MSFKVKKNLTKTLFKFITGEPRYLKFQGALFVGKELKAKEGAKKMEPATLAFVTDLETGEEGQVIINAVVKSVLTDEYANDAYVGKCFQITKNARAPGKTYDPFSIAEIEDPAEIESVAEASANVVQDALGKARAKRN